MKVGILGLGLMGSSMALALKKYCNNIIVFGLDSNENHLDYSTNNNIIDYKLSNKMIAEMDIIFLAVPVKSIAMVINNIDPYLDKDKTLLTDMGSTKSYICEEIKKNFPHLDFIGGHPMTGREVSGPENSNPDLYTNMTYILIDNKDNKKLNQDINKAILDDKLDGKDDKLNSKKEQLKNILNKIGCNLVFMDAERHDKIVALTSHLPHFIAISLINKIIKSEDEYPDINKIMGQGFRDFTRIAACSPDMWKDIFVSNREHIIDQVNQMIEQMIVFRDTIDNGDELNIYKLLESAQEKRLLLNEEFEKVSNDEL